MAAVWATLGCELCGARVSGLALPAGPCPRHGGDCVQVDEESDIVQGWVAVHLAPTLRILEAIPT